MNQPLARHDETTGIDIEARRLFEVILASISIPVVSKEKPYVAESSLLRSGKWANISLVSALTLLMALCTRSCCRF